MGSTNNERRKWTVPQLAKAWGVSAHKVVGFIRSGELRAIDLASKSSSRPRYAIDVGDIEAFERGRRVVPNDAEASSRKMRQKSSSNVKNFF